MIESIMLTVALHATPQQAPSFPAVVSVGEKEFTGASLYRGRMFRSKWEGVRKCIRARESNNKYHAVNRTGKYRGAYQMSPELAVGAGWMIQKELRAHHGVPKKFAVAIGETLRNTPINKWSELYQDMAFWLVFDNGKGKSHWGHQVPGTACY